MEDWQAAFADKSERRRKRAFRRRAVRRTILVALVGVAILAGLWATERLADSLFFR